MPYPFGCRRSTRAKQCRLAVEKFVWKISYRFVGYAHSCGVQEARQAVAEYMTCEGAPLPFHVSSYSMHTPLFFNCCNICSVIFPLSPSPFFSIVSLSLFFHCLPLPFFPLSPSPLSHYAHTHKHTLSCRFSPPSPQREITTWKSIEIFMLRTEGTISATLYRLEKPRTFLLELLLALFMLQLGRAVQRAQSRKTECVLLWDGGRGRHWKVFVVNDPCLCHGKRAAVWPGCTTECAKQLLRTNKALKTGNSSRLFNESSTLQFEDRSDKLWEILQQTPHTSRVAHPKYRKYCDITVLPLCPCQIPITRYPPLTLSLFSLLCIWPLPFSLPSIYLSFSSLYLFLWTKNGIKRTHLGCTHSCCALLEHSSICFM